MTLSVDPAWIVLLLLVAIRLSPLFVLTPVFGSAQIPARVRLLFLLMLAAALVAGGVPAAAVDLASLSSVIGAAVTELVVGAAFAFGVSATFAVFMFGGRLLDLQMGFGVASLFDPITRAHGPLFGTALNLLAVTVFFALDGHHLILRGLAYSFTRIPPGGSLLSLDLTAVVKLFGMIFSHGLVIVAPAVFALFLLDVAFALVSRTMPQMNVFVVSMPLKIVVGLLVLSLSMQHLLPAMRRIYAAMPSYWERLLGGT